MKKNELLKRVDPRLHGPIAHRGLHDAERTENGLLAFKNAREHNLAFELDVHITTDNKLIVCHDSELKRTTGKEGIIEHLSSDYIRENYRLLDGEVVPTLKEVLEENNEQVPIVIELKVYEKNYKALSKLLMEELKVIKDTSKYMIISFDPRGLKPFVGTKFITSFLLTGQGKYACLFILRNMFDSIDIEKTAVKKKKVQRYRKNHLVNVWTVTSEDEMKDLLDYSDSFTFQEFDGEKAKEIYENQKKV